MKKSMQGVTLIELMIVVVVLAIISTIAIPSYRNYMLRAQRSDAMTALLRLRAAEEKFFLQNNTYTNQMGPAGLRLTGTAGTTMNTENNRYTVSFTAQTANTFTAVATATGGQTKDTNCLTFTIDDQGVRGSSPGAMASCWK